MMRSNHGLFGLSTQFVFFLLQAQQVGCMSWGAACSHMLDHSPRNRVPVRLGKWECDASHAGIDFLGMLVGIALMPSSAFAWGDVGHRVICQIRRTTLAGMRQTSLNIEAGRKELSRSTTPISLGRLQQSGIGSKWLA